MSKKTVIVLIIGIILIISTLLLISAFEKYFPKPDASDAFIDADIFVTTEQFSSKYIMEKNTEKYSARVLESENKDFVTLFVETNIVESGDKVSINYNNEKLLLNTANPILENIIIDRSENSSTFELDLESLKNYGIIFIKKVPTSVISKVDININ